MRDFVYHIVIPFLIIVFILIGVPLISGELLNNEREENLICEYAMKDQVFKQVEKYCSSQKTIEFMKGLQNGKRYEKESEN